MKKTLVRRNAKIFHFEIQMISPIPARILDRMLINKKKKTKELVIL